MIHDLWCAGTLQRISNYRVVKERVIPYERRAILGYTNHQKSPLMVAKHKYFSRRKGGLALTN